MKKLKYLFLLILCLGIINTPQSISAQTDGDKILVAGKHQLKQSDVEGLIDFFEWAFEAKFSEAEREKFQAYTINQFRFNPSEKRKTISDLNNLLPQILASSQDVQAKTRKDFLDVFLAETRKNSDESSRMLLSIYEAAQDNNAQQTDAEVKETGNNVSSGGAVSQSIVGKWSRGNGSGFIDYTGKTQYKSGETFTFEFFPDGTVECVYEKDVLSIVQCRTKENSKARGTVRVNGDTMTINLGAGTSAGSSTCEKNNNFNRALPATTITKKFTVKKLESITRPDKPTILCFEGQEDSACFERSGK